MQGVALEKYGRVESCRMALPKIKIERAAILFNRQEAMDEMMSECKMMTETLKGRRCGRVRGWRHVDWHQ